MSTIHYTETTTSTPERFLAGLTDFGPGREKLFGTSPDNYLKVNGRGPYGAGVTEGSGGVWNQRQEALWPANPTHRDGQLRVSAQPTGQRC